MIASPPLSPADLIPSATSERSSTIHSGRLYWSILEAPRGTRIRPGPLPIGLHSAFHDDVPELAPDDGLPEVEGASRRLHAVCTPFGDGRVLACGVSLDELSDMSTLDALTPAELPEFIRREFRDSVTQDPRPVPDADTLVASLNLLVGELEPAHRKSARQRRGILLLATATIASFVLHAGLNRRIANDREVVAEAIVAADTAAAEMSRSLAAPVRLTPDALPSVLAVVQRTTDAATRIDVPRDASSPLAALLDYWPRNDRGNWTIAIQSLSVTADQISLTLTIDGDTAAFLRVLTTPAGWTLQEPRLSTVAQATTLSSTQSTSLTRLTLIMTRNTLPMAANSPETAP